MPRRKTTRPPRKRLDTSGQGKPEPALRGGLSNFEGEQGAAQGFEKLLERYEVNLPSSVDSLRKKMKAKGGELKQDIAEALAAAAYQHSKVPDEGTRLYGRAFQTLTQSEKDSLLSLLEGNDAGVVQQAYGDYVDAEPTSQQPVTGAAGRARERAEAAYEAMPVVDLDETITPEGSGKTVLPVGRGDEVVTVSDRAAAGWTQAQRDRGYRRIQYAPDPRTKQGARSVIEVVQSRADEFEQGVTQPAAVPNPNYGQARDVYQPVPEADPVPSAERIVPTSFDQLSIEARAAVARGNEIQDTIDLYEAENPDFLQTREGQRLVDKLSEIGRDYPEALPFIDDPDLTGRPLPRDPQIEPSGRAALPKNMRLGYFIGDQANRSTHQWETRGDRRDRFGIPADAPNRAGWIEVATEPPEYRIVENADGTTTREMVKPRRAASARVQSIATLPYSGEISRGGPVKTARADNNVDRLQTSPRRYEDAPVVADADDASIPDDAIASDDDLAQSEFGPVMNPDESARPVEDISRRRQPKEGRSYVLTKGTAEGSPTKVKSDRDFALREGKSMQEKLAEQLFRASMEWAGDPEFITTARNVGDAGPSAAAFDAPEGADFAAAYVDEATGGGGEIRRRSSGSSPRRAKMRLLPLDNIVPVWRGLIEDVADGQIIYRRPTAYEIAGFLVDRADIPDPAMATRLAPLVQASMDALEGSSPAGKAARVANRPFVSSQARARDLDAVIQSQRQAGDDRPRYSPEAERLIAESQSGSLEGFTPGDETSMEGFVAGEPAGATPPADATLANAFRQMAERRKSGGSPTNITGLLALLTGVGAGAAQASEPGERFLTDIDLPFNQSYIPAEYEAPLESLAMARRRSVSATVAAARAKQAAAAASPKASPKPAPAAKPAPKPAAQAKPQPAPQPAPAAAAASQPAAPAQAPQAPRQPMFPNSPTANLARAGIGSAMPFLRAATGYLPDAALAIGGISGAVAAAPYIVPPVQRGLEYLRTGVPPAAAPTASDADAEMQRIFEDVRREMDPDAPPDNNTTLDIRTMQQMLGRSRTPQVM